MFGLDLLIIGALFGAGSALGHHTTTKILTKKDKEKAEEQAELIRAALKEEKENGKA